VDNSVALTGGISVSSAALIPVIQWIFPTIPAPVTVSIAAGVITLAHALHVLAVRKGWYPSDDVSPNVVK
jgi:hypothetical protein